MASRRRVPFNGLHIDASPQDWLSGIAGAFAAKDPRVRYRVQRLWARMAAASDERLRGPAGALYASGPAPAVLACLSVRSAFDAYLRVKAFPEGSQIVFSAITIPDMVLIARHHGLTVVPIDLHPRTLAPRVDQLKTVLNPRTVAVVIAHIYGRRNSLDPVLDAVRERQKDGVNADVIEDCAEAFDGSYCGHPDADLSMFSFGTIKVATALGGALVRVKQRAVFAEMETLQCSYPVQSRAAFCKKILQLAAPMTVLNNRHVMAGAAALLLDGCDLSYDVMATSVVKMMKGFPHNLFGKLRHQPSQPLLTLMYKRLDEFDRAGFERGTANGDIVLRELPDGVEVPGDEAEVRNYWLYPILADEPDELCQELVRRGVCAFRNATQLALVEPPIAQDASELPPLPSVETARALLHRVLYLPVHRRLREDEARQVAEVLRQAMESLQPRARL